MVSRSNAARRDSIYHRLRARLSAPDRLRFWLPTRS